MTSVKVPISPKIHDIERYLVEVGDWHRAPRGAQWLASGYPKKSSRKESLECAQEHP